MKQKNTSKSKRGGGSSSHDLFASAKVAADPMAFAKRGDVFRGYYIVSPGENYMTKEGKWTRGCTAPDAGNWWDTQPDAAHALEKFRKANAKHHPVGRERHDEETPNHTPTTDALYASDIPKWDDDDYVPVPVYLRMRDHARQLENQRDKFISENSQAQPPDRVG